MSCRYSNTIPLKKTIAIESKHLPEKKKKKASFYPYTPVQDCDPLHQDQPVKLSASREEGSPIKTHVKDIEDFLSWFKQQVRFW